jgi:hypothetical protein
MSPDSKDTPTSRETLPADPATPSEFWEDLLDIYLSPASVFARRASGKWGAAWLALIALLFATTIVFSDAMRPFVENTLRDSMTRLMANMDRGDAQMAVGFARSAFIYGLPISVAFGVLMAGVLLWVIARFFSVPLMMSQALVITVYSSYPRIIEQIAKGAEAMFAGDVTVRTVYSLSYGPLRFLNTGTLPDHITMLLGNVELFSIWCLVLAVLGVRTVGRTSTITAVLVAGLAWLVGLLIALLLALR